MPEQSLPSFFRPVDMFSDWPPRFESIGVTISGYTDFNFKDLAVEIQRRSLLASQTRRLNCPISEVMIRLSKPGDEVLYQTRARMARCRLSSGCVKQISPQEC